MADERTDQKGAWVGRVLGVAVGGPAALGAGAAAAAAEIAAARVSKNVGVVEFAKIRLRWGAARTARAEAIANMHAVCAAMLQDPEVRADPEYADMQTAADSVESFMPDLPEEIDDYIDALVSAEPAERETARGQTLAAIRSFRGELDATPELKLLQELPAGAYEIYDRVAAALNDLEAALAG